MSDKEGDFGRRQSDQEFREWVRERIASLTTGENMQDDRLEQLEGDLGRLFEAINGHANEAGMLADIREVKRIVNELWKVMMPDSLGNGGVINRLRGLEDKRDERNRTRESALKFWGPILIALISSGALLIREWPDIAARWHTNIEIVEGAKPHKKKVRHKKPAAPVEEPAQDEKEEVPE